MRFPPKEMRKRRIMNVFNINHRAFVVASELFCAKLVFVAHDFYIDFFSIFFDVVYHYA